jgi:hypothetical protein
VMQGFKPFIRGPRFESLEEGILKAFGFRV